jgi:hypothetical protein
MNPLPYSNAQSGPTFEPPCNETVDRKMTDTPSCSGRDPFNTLIIDQLLVPASVKPGKYVLGIRWDCEKVGALCRNRHAFCSPIVFTDFVSSCGCAVGADLDQLRRYRSQLITGHGVHVAISLPAWT